MPDLSYVPTTQTDHHKYSGPTNDQLFPLLQTFYSQLSSIVREIVLVPEMMFNTKMKVQAASLGKTLLAGKSLHCFRQKYQVGGRRIFEQVEEFAWEPHLGRDKRGRRHEAAYCRCSLRTLPAGFFGGRLV